MRKKRRGTVTVHASGASLATLSGEYDIASAADLKDMFQDALETSTRLIVDLTQVTFLDSSALSLLIWGKKQAVAVGGDMVLVAPASNVAKVLRITQLDKVFAVFPGIEAAARGFEGAHWP